jgi:hypothetical protein
MKNLILFLIPLIFLGCNKEDMPIEVSEGTRLVKMEFYTENKSLNEDPDIIKEFLYDEAGRLTGIDHYIHDLTKPSLKHRKVYNDNGVPKLTTLTTSKESGYELSGLYEMTINSENNLVEKMTSLFVPHNSDEAQKSYERLLFYNSDNQLILDSLNDHYFSQVSDFFGRTFRFYWEDGNVVRRDKFNLDGKLIEIREFKYDRQKTFQISDFIEALYFNFDRLTPKGKNNVTEIKYYDLTGSGPRRICNPCKTTYKYNSYGLPYFSSTNYGEKVIYTYEKE